MMTFMFILGVSLVMGNLSGAKRREKIRIAATK